MFRDALTAHPEIGEPLIAYAVKANSNVSVLRTLARLGRRGRHGFRGRDPPRAGRRRAGRADRLLRRRQDRRRDRLRAGGRRRRDQRRVRAGARPRRPGRRRAGRARRASPSGSIRTSAPAATPRSPPARPSRKFGVSLGEAERLYAKAATAPSLQPLGVACHIGSQITDLAPLRGRLRQDARPGRAAARPRA